MSDNVSASADPAIAQILAGFQDQIDALTEVLEAHQRMFERLRASGVLTSEKDHDEATTV